MNLEALKAAAANLKTGGGAEGYFSTKVLTAEGVPIRLLPEPAILGGIFYFEVIKFWMMINGKRAQVICSSTFGKKSVMDEELELAKQSDDEELLAIVNDTNPKTAINRSPEFWMAALQLEYKTNRAGEIEKIIVVDDRAKIFQCAKATLLQEMVKVATSRKALAPTKGATDGIADRELGSNILLSKTGKDKLTRYAAVLDEQCEMDAKYYINIPNVYEIAKAQMPNPSYQRAAIRNHLYGEAIPAEVQAKEDARAAAAKEALKALQVEAPVATPKKKAKAVDDEDEIETPVPKKKAVAAPPPAPKKKVAPIDEDELEEEIEEEEAPVPVKKAVTKKAAFIDEDEDEEAAPKQVAKKKASILDEGEDEELAPIPRKKSAAPAAPVKKAVVAKKTILDDLDDIEEEE